MHCEGIVVWPLKKENMFFCKRTNKAKGHASRRRSKEAEEKNKENKKQNNKNNQTKKTKNKKKRFETDIYIAIIWHMQHKRTHKYT